MMTSFKICLLLVLVTRISQSQTSVSNKENSCDHKATCSECIQTENCAWCVEPIMDGKPRCFDSSLTTYHCGEEYQWNPDNDQRILSLQELTLPRSSNKEYQWNPDNEQMRRDSVNGSPINSGSQQSIVQIKPQRTALKLRKNQALHIQIQYAAVEDYPMDVYFLMDLSKSMESEREKLIKLGELLAQTLPNITSNFRLGFGSFINTSPGSEHPCVDCSSAYAFKNHMSLDTDATLFSEQLRRVNIASSPDVSGGALEAIMQAVVCRNQIGWRESARRIMVFSTNAGFHHADESKLDGMMVSPNDGYCHLDTNGMYTTSRVQDYPSIAQIDTKIWQTATNVIFAVPSSQTNIYENLSHQVTGSVVAHLGDDSSNVVELIRDEYSKISSSVELKDNSTTDFEITYSSSCLGNRHLPIKTNQCDGLKVGDVVTFTAEIVVTSCPQNEEHWKQKFQIYPVGVDQSLIVDVEIVCSCPCENSEICTENNSELERSPDCRADNSSVVCNGRGVCVYGVCECVRRPHHDEVIWGKFCECDNFSCDRHNGLLCSGSDHGICSCGVCQCQPGWIGDACDCRASNDTCIRRPGGVICSGHGICECGSCRCDVTPDGPFSGRFCDKCPTCQGLCHQLKKCVQCKMYNTGPLAASGLCAETCTKIAITGFDKIEADEQMDEHLCTFYDEVDCRFQFVYRETDTFEVAVRAQRERECPLRPNIHNMGPLSVTKPYGYSQPSNSSDELFTAKEIEVILQDVYKGMKHCKTKEDQLKLLILLTVKYIYRQQP